MPRHSIVLLAALLAACDLVPKAPPSGTPPDTIAPRLAGVRTDTMSDAAAAESAKKFNRAEAARHAPLAITISGSEHFQADSGFRVTCIASESDGERLLQVEALGRDVRVNFTLYNARDGEVPVGNVYTRRRAKSRIGNFQVSIRAHSYADGNGRADITDPIGRTGAMHASNFIKMGTKKNQSHRADVSVHLRWNCE